MDQETTSQEHTPAFRTPYAPGNVDMYREQIAKRMSDANPGESPVDPEDVEIVGEVVELDVDGTKKNFRIGESEDQQYLEFFEV